MKKIKNITIKNPILKIARRPRLEQEQSEMATSSLRRSHLLYAFLRHHSQPPLAGRSRFIATTAARFGLFDTIKGVFTGKKSSVDESFSLIAFADQMDKARRLGSFKKFQVGRCSEATVSDAFKKHSAALRYLGSIDPSGEKLTNIHKQEAAKNCNCTITDVEHVLAKYTWAKEAQKKIEKLKEEGKPIPKTFSEVQKLMGSTPVDVGRSNLAKSGQISRNAPCPCNSGKRYKRCCGPPEHEKSSTSAKS